MTELGGLERARYVARMFSRITHSYDRMNTIMSAGRHHAWRSLAVDMAVGGMTGPALDLATGTGDFALGLVGREGVTRLSRPTSAWRCSRRRAKRLRGAEWRTG